MKKLLSILALCSCMASPAMAATLYDFSTPSKNEVKDYSDVGLISFDLDLFTNGVTTIKYQLSSDDLTGPLSFNAVVRNFTNTALFNFNFALDKSSFSKVGSTYGEFGSVLPTLSGDSKTAHLQLVDGAEINNFSVGDALGGSVNWTIATTGFKAGDVLTITSAVPEPETYAMMLAGLGLISFAARRRQA